MEHADLVQNELRYRILAENMKDAIWVLDTATMRYTYFSPSIQKIFGYTPAELIELPFHLSLPAEIAAVVVENIQHQVEEFVLEDPCTPKYQSVEMEGIRKDGSPVWVEVSTCCNLNQTNGHVEIHGLTREITKRKQIEHELRKSEARYRLLAENMKDVIWILDTQTNHFSYISPSVLGLRGYTPEELMRQPVGFQFKPDRQRQLYASIRKIVAEFHAGVGEPDKFFTLELEQVCKDGTTVWTESIARCVMNQENRHVEIHGVSRDISEKKKAQEALRASETKFRTAVDFSYDWEFWIAPDSSIQYMSPSCERITGYPAEELIAQPSLLSDMIHPDDRTHVGSHFSKTESGFFHGVDFRIIRRDGEIRWIAHTCQDVMDQDGKWLGRRGSNRDVTENHLRAQILLESELRYRELVEDANVIILMVDIDGKITFINEYGMSFFGYSSGELPGLPFRELLSPLCRPPGDNRRQRQVSLFDGESFHSRSQQESITRQGRRVWVDWTVRQRVDSLTGELSHVLVGVDVTAMLRMQEEQKKRFERKRRQDLLNEAVTGRISPQTACETAIQLGLDLTEPLVCVVFSFSIVGEQDGKHWFYDPIERQVFMDSFVDLLQFHELGEAWQTNEGIAIVKSMSGKKKMSFKNVAEYTETIAGMAANYSRGVDMCLGASGSSASAMTLPALYEQSRAAVVFGPVIEPGRSIYYWKELGCYQFVIHDLGSAKARQFVDDQIGCLLQIKEKKHQEMLLATLKGIVAGKSVQEMADLLHIHPKTIYYRKKTLEDLLGVRLDSRQALLNLTVALTIHEGFTYRMR